MAAFGVPIVEDVIGIRFLGPTARRRVEFIGENAHRNRDLHAFDVEIPLAPIFPIESGSGDSRISQPCDRDIVEDVVAGEALELSLKDARDQSIAACIVIQDNDARFL